ncbi:MAG: class I SAM-dependent methyltransferase [Candidatus Neomarinimicrobiota bacterium]
MLNSYKNIYYQIEDYHWWNVSRRDIILKLLNPLISDGMKILDIGCSSGSLINKINSNKKLEIHGIDISSKAIKYSKDRGIQNTQVMNADKLKYRDKEFDIIIASDVLEHIENDNNALIEWKRVLKDNGFAIIFVPAIMALWSHNDIYSEHFRRYEKSQFRKRLINSGFNIERSSYWNFTLFIPIFIFRRLQRILSSKNSEFKSELKKSNPIINKLLKMILFIENRILNKINFPIGVSLFAICKK